jgi:hypothetical protein
VMHEPEKSDSVVVAEKPTNKAERSAAEPVEPRAETKGNAGQQSTRRAQDRASVSQALERVRQAARQRKKERFGQVRALGGSGSVRRRVSRCCGAQDCTHGAASQDFAV